MPGLRSIAAITAPAPAIGGTAAADTNAAASMRRKPVRESASMRRTRSATGTVASFWRPSRGPTSRISTRAGHSVIGTGYAADSAALLEDALDPGDVRVSQLRQRLRRAHAGGQLEQELIRLGRARV